MEIDLEAVQLMTSEELQTLLAKSRRPRRSCRQVSAFVPGPIPLSWVDAAEAAGIPGRVYLRLWRIARMRNRRGLVVTANLSQIARETRLTRPWVSLLLRRL